MHRSKMLACAALLLAVAPTLQARIEVRGEAGAGPSNFGARVAVLPNGNVVVTDPNFDGPNGLANEGAIYLFDPEGNRISFLRGGTIGALAGNAGIVVLESGHAVVLSPAWNQQRGAVTWIDGTTGASGTISGANSLVGSTVNDRVGNRGVVALRNGHYVVVSPEWDAPGAVDAGAVTWGDGSSGARGPIDVDRSWIGDGANKYVGFDAAFNGHRVVELANGHVVFGSPQYYAPGEPPSSQHGAVTWMDGTQPGGGRVSPGTSLIGGAGARVGESITPLSDGNYVIAAPLASSVALTHAGAVAWLDGSAPTIATLDQLDALRGDRPADLVGSGGVTPLHDGAYVVLSPAWHSGEGFGPDGLGAATWRAGATTGAPEAAVVDVDNSLIGARDGDFGDASVTALANGNYVVALPSCDRDTSVDAGNVMLGLHGQPLIGTPLPSRGLAGEALERVGSGGVTALVNGHFVVASPDWSPALGVGRGAVTWCDGAEGCASSISTQNSLTGSPGNRIGSGGVRALANGDYVAISPEWDAVSTVGNHGAATWGDGAGGNHGLVTADNSRVGRKPGDGAEMSVLALGNGAHLVSMPRWNTDDANDVGAIAHCAAHVPCKGAALPDGILTGSAANDFVGATTVGSRVMALGRDRFAVVAARLNDAAGISVGGALFFGDPPPPTGPILQHDPVLGSAAFLGDLIVIASDPHGQRVAIGLPMSDKVILEASIGIFRDGLEQEGVP